MLPVKPSTRTYTNTIFFNLDIDTDMNSMFYLKYVVNILIALGSTPNMAAASSTYFQLQNGAFYCHWQ